MLVCGLHLQSEYTIGTSYPWGELLTNRFTETLYFVDGEGLVFRSSYDLDRTIDENRLRCTTIGSFQEDTNGVQWSTRLLMGERLNENCNFLFCLDRLERLVLITLTTSMV